MKKKSRKKVKAAKRRKTARPRPKKRSKSKNIAKRRRKKEPLREAVVNGHIPSPGTVLEQLFGGQQRMKLWKIFLLNVNREFTLKQLNGLTKIKNDVLISELRDLMKQGFITGTRKHVIMDQSRKESTIVYKANPQFPLLSPLIETVLAAVPRSAERVVEHVQSLPKLKTVLLSGFFTSKLGHSTVPVLASQSPIDMLLIFEKIPPHVSSRVAELERGLGRELRYAALDQEDFKYRHSIGDKLIRDVLDFEHIVALDKMGFFK